MNIKEHILVRFITAAMFAGTLGFTWDAWWHGAVGREAFFIPPHIMAQAAILLAIVAGLYGWWKWRGRKWLILAGFLVLIPASAPFDELWHSIYGVENLSEIWIIWSPPHIAIALGLLGAFVALLPLIKQDPDITARRLFGAAAFVGVLDVLFFEAMPLDPLEGWALLGFAGAGILGAILAGVLIFARQWLGGVGGATLVIAGEIMLFSVFEFGRFEIAEGVIVQPHAHPPAWLTVFAFLSAAVLIDVTKKLPGWATGALAATAWAGILYGFAHMFFGPEFDYTLHQGVTAVISAAVGGILAGAAVAAFLNKPQGADTTNVVE